MDSAADAFIIEEIVSQLSNLTTSNEFYRVCLRPPGGGHGELAVIKFKIHCTVFDFN